MQYLLCLIAIATTTALYSADFEDIQIEDDFSRLDILIEAHQENLENERMLKKLLTEYKHLEKTCIHNAQDTESANRLVEVAHELYSNIKGLFLEDYFRPQFLEELQTLSKMHEPHIPSVK